MTTPRISIVQAAEQIGVDLSLVRAAAVSLGLVPSAGINEQEIDKITGKLRADKALSAE